MRPQKRPMTSGLRTRLLPTCRSSSPMLRPAPAFSFRSACSISSVPAIIIVGRCTAIRIDIAMTPSGPTVRPTSGRPMKIVLAKAEETPASTPILASRPKNRVATIWPAVHVMATPEK